MDLFGTFGQALLLLAVIVLVLITLSVTLQLRKIQREAQRRARKASEITKHDRSIRAKLLEDGFSEKEIRDALNPLKTKQSNG
jgi:predicted Holliday junction resolvase-like endonuclease